MDSLNQIRQMMAEQKFFDAQLLIEAILDLPSCPRHDLLRLYYEALKSQKKKLPGNILLELAEFELKEKNGNLIEEILDQIVGEEDFSEALKIRIRVSEKYGRLKELYDYLSLFYVNQFEKQIPHIPLWLEEICQKYFKHDFSLELKNLALKLITRNLDRCEEMIKGMMTYSFEKEKRRKINQKFKALEELLMSFSKKGRLELYQNFCALWNEGVREKKDYKKIIEMVIYFEDFKFQVFVLELMNRLGIANEAQMFADAIKLNASYDYIYIEKYFKNLSDYFFQRETQIVRSEEIKNKNEIPDLSLERNEPRDDMSLLDYDESEDNQRDYENILKYQKYEINQLLEIVISFLHSGMPKAALKTVNTILEQTEKEEDYLRGCYLKLLCLLSLKDYRGAIDISLEALDRATKKEDILAFLYGRAEGYLYLGLKNEARKLLNQIIAIDSKYRLAKERLEKL